MSERDHVLASVAAGQHGLFTRQQALHAGYGSATIDRRLRSGAWQRVGPGVIGIAGVPSTFERSVRAAVMSVPGSAASHEAAGSIQRFRYIGRVVVAVTAGSGSLHRVEGVVVHRYQDLSSQWVETIDGLAVTRPERTMIDLGAVLRPARLERVLDAALADGRFAMPALVGAFNRLARRGRRGIGVIRPLIEARGDGFVAVGSELERRFVDFLDRFGFPDPERQRPILGRDDLIGLADFTYVEQRVILELDGRLGHAQLLDFELDRRRDQQAMAAGWRVVRITWRQLHDRPMEVRDLLATILGVTPHAA